VAEQYIPSSEQTAFTAIYASYRRRKMRRQVVASREYDELNGLSDLERFYVDFSFPTFFTRRMESFLDACFLISPTIIIIQILVPTLGFLYSTECYLEHASSAFSLDVTGHQWY
jgi:hypothetical protein